MFHMLIGFRDKMTPVGFVSDVTVTFVSMYVRKLNCFCSLSRKLFTELSYFTC